MASLPSYAIIRMSNWQESFDPSVERTEMERGLPKQRTINSQVLMKLHASLLFLTNADELAFQDWYFDTIERVEPFDMQHPRTGATISVRFDGASIGDLRSIAGTDYLWQRDVVIEYLK